MFLTLLTYLGCTFSEGNSTSAATSHCGGGNTSRTTTTSCASGKASSKNKLSSPSVASSGILFLAILLWGLSVMVLYHRHCLLQIALSSTAASTALMTTATIEPPPASTSTGTGRNTAPTGTPTAHQIHVVFDDDDDDDDDDLGSDPAKHVIETEYYRDILGSQPVDEHEASSHNFVNISMDGVWWMEALHPAHAPTESTLSFSHSH